VPTVSVTITAGALAAPIVSQESPAFESATDEQLVEHVRSGQHALFAILVRRYNRRLYRIARAIIRDDHEAEDIVQQAHLAAFMHLHQFRGQAKFSTWLMRIATHEAFARRRARQRGLEVGRAQPENGAALSNGAESPEETAARRELARALEAAIDALPEPYRLAFVLRDVEGLNTTEVATGLGLSEENVRIRLHRARQLLRDGVAPVVGHSVRDVFPFAGERCARIQRNVMQIISTLA
jgi:RNA polymerase sigma-70 factor, ECF subfamily